MKKILLAMVGVSLSSTGPAVAWNDVLPGMDEEQCFEDVEIFGDDFQNLEFEDTLKVPYEKSELVPTPKNDICSIDPMGQCIVCDDTSSTDNWLIVGYWKVMDTPWIIACMSEDSGSNWSQVGKEEVPDGLECLRVIGTDNNDQMKLQRLENEDIPGNDCDFWNFTKFGHIFTSEQSMDGKGDMDILWGSWSGPPIRRRWE